MAIGRLAVGKSSFFLKGRGAAPLIDTVIKEKMRFSLYSVRKIGLEEGKDKTGNSLTLFLLLYMGGGHFAKLHMIFFSFFFLFFKQNFFELSSAKLNI